MRRAFFAVVAFSALCTAAVPAFAQAPKIIVEQFSGSGSEKLRQAVIKALGKAGADVVSEKKVAAAETDLGLVQTSDAYGAVARQLKADGFVGGSVSPGKKTRGKIVVRDAGGKAVGDAAYSGANLSKMVSAADAGLARDLGNLLRKVSGSSADSSSAAAEPSPPADSEDATPKRKKKPASDETDGGGADVAKKADKAEPSEPERTSGGLLGGWKGLDWQVGIHGYSRKLTYNQPITTRPQESDNPGQPALALNADFFFLPFLGVTAGGEYSLVAKSNRDTGNGTTSYSGKSYEFHGGLKGKLNLSPLELTLGVTYGQHTFTVGPDTPASDNSSANVPPVTYSNVRAGLGGRLNLGTTFALLAGGGYIYVLNPGGIRTYYFPGAKASGGDGYVGAAIPLAFLSKGLEARVTFDIRRYVFAMNSIMADATNGYDVAGGATDQYLGFTVALGGRSFGGSAE